jgi:hypothetical protein
MAKSATVRKFGARSANPLVAFAAGCIGGLATFLVAFRQLISTLVHDNCSFPGYMVGIDAPGAPSGGDVIAVANTYIVYTTIIFVVTTIVVTIAALYFGWQFSHDKEQQLADRMAELKANLRQTGGASKELIEAALENDEARSDLVERVRVVVNTVMEEAIKKGASQPGLQQSLVDALKAAKTT